MTSLKSEIKKLIPRKLRPVAKRQFHFLQHIRGSLSSRQRLGVVVMLHVGRCGSTVLANLLEQNPSIFWDGKLSRKFQQRNANSLDINKWLRRRFAFSGHRYYGFEFKILQYPHIFDISNEDFLNIFRDVGVTHYIILYRRNTLRQVASHYASRARGTWHATDYNKNERKTFSLDVSNIDIASSSGQSLISYLEDVDDAYDQTRELLASEKVLEIQYEDDIDRNGAKFAYMKICQFLDLEAGDVQVKNVRLNPYPLKVVLKNYDEIEKTLKSTRFAWMTSD